ncbi:MAG: GntR family transcriptional regulator, partial [Exiguobacterium sp.]|nr:GntR family transcriptional regulator [Exiguobacterium sp.]MDX5425104.1 GntR family transcriptional regulator [Exiguobacterium sp.]MDX6772532.1 GntR family transcriptional regulator [Exiguobacterium sp.]
DSYFRKELVVYLDRNITEQSIYNYFRNDQKLAIGFADRVIYADFLNAEDAKLLELNENDPALLVDNTVYLTNGQIFDVSRSTHHFLHVKMLKVSNIKSYTHPRTILACVFFRSHLVQKVRVYM